MTLVYDYRVVLVGGTVLLIDFWYSRTLGQAATVCMIESESTASAQLLSAIADILCYVP